MLAYARFRGLIRHAKIDCACELNHLRKVPRELIQIKAALGRRRWAFLFTANFVCKTSDPTRAPTSARLRQAFSLIVRMPYAQFSRPVSPPVAAIRSHSPRPPRHCDGDLGHVAALRHDRDGLPVSNR